MLNKLLKYDLQYNFKVVSVFYILSIFFALLTRIFLNIENSFIMNIIGKICSGVTISMIFNIIINNIMRLWARFRNNLYKDESYLTHTLPIDKKTLYLSKSLSSIITLFTSILVIGITLFIAYYSKETIEMIKNILLPVANAYDTHIVIIIIAFLFIVFLELANAIQSGYTGIILGNKKNNNKVAFSVIYGFVTYILTQLSILAVVFIFGLFNKDIMNLIYTTEFINVDIIKTLIYLAIAIYISTLIILYFINIKLFKKGVNVD